LNHCFHLLGGELAGSKREKERKREEQKRKEKKSDEDKDRRGRRGTIHHNGITSMPGMEHTLRHPRAQLRGPP
jgi:hypothetical protein